MPHYNQVTLMGNVTRDPQVRRLASGTVVADFGLAVTRPFRDAAGEKREETCFVDCTAFGRQAETIAQYVKKGRPLFVTGRLRFESWDDKTTGQKRSKVGVVIEQFQFLGGRSDESVGDAPAAVSHSRQQRRVESPIEEESSDLDQAEIPF